MRRNFRPNSIRAYLRAARRVLSEADAPLSELTRQHITDYLDCLVAEGAAAQTRNQIMAALRLFMSEVAGAPEATAGVRRAMVPSTVPVLLSGTPRKRALKRRRWVRRKVTVTRGTAMAMETARPLEGPGTRILQVLRDFGDNSIVSSICPKGDHGYVPAVDVIIDTVKECFPPVVR